MSRSVSVAPWKLSDLTYFQSQLTVSTFLYELSLKQAGLVFGGIFVWLKLFTALINSVDVWNLDTCPLKSTRLHVKASFLSSNSISDSSSGSDSFLSDIERLKYISYVVSGYFPL